VSEGEGASNRNELELGLAQGNSLASSSVRGSVVGGRIEGVEKSMAKPPSWSWILSGNLGVSGRWGCCCW